MSLLGINCCLGDVSLHGNGSSNCRILLKKAETFVKPNLMRPHADNIWRYTRSGACHRHQKHREVFRYPISLPIPYK